MNEPAKQPLRQLELRSWQLAVIFLFACCVIVSRRPDAIANAQFWGEDGHIFFADAYNLGWWPALFRTYAGYFHVVPRLGASLALLAPLSRAPLVLNLIAIAVQALPVVLLLSSRSSVWGNLLFRVSLACVYLSLPNSWEVSAIITNSQWLLPLSALLLLVASKPRSAGERLADSFILLLCGLSGPFCIFLLPIAIFLVWKHRDRWRLAEASLLAAACLVQAWGLLNGGFSGRPHYALGASPALFARILASQAYLGTLLGGNGLAAQAGLGYTIVLTGIAAGGTALVVICFFRSPLAMKLFLLLCAMVMVSSLISPVLGKLTGVSAWEDLARGAGARYWFLPTLGFAWTILWCFHSRSEALKAISALLLCVMSFGIVLQWRQPAFQDRHFAEYAKRFESAPVGTAVTIPESPQGWNLTLVKRPSRR